MSNKSSALSLGTGRTLTLTMRQFSKLSKAFPTMTLYQAEMLISAGPSTNAIQGRALMMFGITMPIWHAETFRSLVYHG